MFLLAIVTTMDAMYHRNQIQVVAFTFFNFLCFSYKFKAQNTRIPILKIGRLFASCGTNSSPFLPSSRFLNLISDGII